jgi:hypothetical protein
VAPPAEHTIKRQSALAIVLRRAQASVAQSFAFQKLCGSSTVAQKAVGFAASERAPLIAEFQRVSHHFVAMPASLFLQSWQRGKL